MRNPLVILIILLWALLGWWYYQSHKTCCETTTGSLTEAAAVTTGSAVAGASAAAEETLGPLLFKWSGDSTYLGDGWSAKKRDVLAGLNANQLLEITGLYRSDETNNTSFDNLGLARANKVRQLFSDLSDDRVRLSSRLVNGDIDHDVLFESCDFDYRVNSANIKEIDDKALIYFPFNSTNKLNDREVESYLDDVAERVVASGETVNLSGHTDDIGDDDSNIALGQRRADIVKNYLMSKGVSAGKIRATSSGESQPVATNSTDAGRASNRRTELQIVK